MPFLDIQIDEPLGVIDDAMRIRQAIVPAYLLSVMLYPNESAGRSELIDALVAEAATLALSGSNDLSVSASFAVWLKRAPDYALVLSEGWEAMATSGGDSKEGVLCAGFIAAMVLLIPMVYSLEYQKNIGRNVSYRILSSVIAGLRMRGGSERHIKEIWKRYGNAAHIWSAFFIFEGLPSDDGVSYLDFLAVAERLRLWSENYTPTGALDPLLDGNLSWKAPANMDLSHRVGELGHFYTIERMIKGWIEEDRN